MSKLTKVEQKIADLIYNEVSYMYCDNCRCRSEIAKEDEQWGCDDCHRKYNGWGISKREAESIARKISQL